MRLLSISVNLSLQDLKIARVVSLLVPVIRVFITRIPWTPKVKKQRAGKAEKRARARARALMTCICQTHSYRVLVLVKERTRRHDGVKPVADVRFSNRRSRRPDHRRPPLRSTSSSRFRSGNARRTRTLHTDDTDHEIY